jgi:hypothetical protein
MAFAIPIAFTVFMPGRRAERTGQLVLRLASYDSYTIHCTDCATLQCKTPSLLSWHPLPRLEWFLHDGGSSRLMIGSGIGHPHASSSTPDSCIIRPTCCMIKTDPCSQLGLPALLRDSARAHVHHAALNCYSFLSTSGWLRAGLISKSCTTTRTQPENAPCVTLLQ